MAGNDTNVDIAELGLLPLWDLYRSIQDQLVLTTEKSLDLGKKSLAGRLDDVLLRQKLWEVDIRLEDGGLSDFEASDALASSIIRRYLDDIRDWLQVINGTISGSDNETNDEKETMSLLYETNTKLCDQVEIFDAIAAGNDWKATTIGQLRLQLEKENEILQAGGGKKSPTPFVLSTLRESEIVAADIQSNRSSEEHEARPTESSAELAPTSSQQMPKDSPTTEDKALGWPDVARFSPPPPHQLTPKRIKMIDSALGEPEIFRRVRDKHASVLIHYNNLVRYKWEKGSHTETAIIPAFKIERARAQQWRDHILPEKHALGFWSLCELILTSKEELLRKIIQYMEARSLLYGLQGQGRFDPYSPYSSISFDRASSGHKASDEGVIVARSSSPPDPKNPGEWLEDSVRQLSYWNNTLVDLSSRLKQESLRRQLRISLSIHDMVELKHVESASYLLGHSDLEQLAKVRIAIKHIVKGVQLQNYSLDRLKDLFWLDKAEIGWPSKPSTNNEEIVSATYRGESVIILWLRIPEHIGGPDEYLESLQFEGLIDLRCFSGVLNASRVPLGLSTLHTLGYLEQSPDLIGCVYRLPPGASSSHLPMTLHKLLDSAGTETAPELGKRFELSIALVKTVHSLHNMGLVLRDIRPKNILFWPTAATGTEPDLGRPYLIGFNASPSRGQEITTSPSDTTEEEELWYRHPYSWSSSAPGVPYMACYDIFSLGVVLFEIGLWALEFRTGQPDSGRTSHSIQSHLEKRFSEENFRTLGRCVGKRYRDAVRVCLSGELIDVFNRYSQEESLRAYLNEVETKVVGPIAMCNA